MQRLVEKSLNTTERWARGEKSVTLKDVENAAAAVWSAAHAANYAAAVAAAAGAWNAILAAVSAADAAWDDANYTAAYDVASYSSAAHAAWSDAWNAASYSITMEKALKKFADIIRKIQPDCPKFKKRVTG